MRNILSDSTKFNQLFVAEDKQLNFIVNVEKHIADLLKDLKNYEGISEIIYKSFKLRGCGFGILYGLYKVHKHIVDNSPPFRPIMSVIKRPPFNLARYLVLFLEPITTNMYIVKSSVKFAQKIADQEEEETVSLCYVSLFSNVAKSK